MTERSIQLAVTKHANKIFGENVVKKVDKNQNKVLCESDDDDSIGFTTHFNVDEKYKNKFKINTIEGKGRSRKVLEPGWSDALHDMIADSTSAPCIFQFSHGNVKGNEFTANAECSECGGTLTAISSENRNKISVKIVYGEGEHTFQKRRRLTSARAQSLVPDLEKDTVFNVHSDLVNEINPDSEFLPRNYVSEKSLSNVKHRYINSKNNSLTALRDLKYGEYCETIKEIGTDPFFVIFWTQAQKFVFFQTAKRSRIVISIDATGGLVSYVGLVNDLEKKVKLPHIFLYLICLKMPSGKSIPIAQFLSGQQDTIKIKYFFERFLAEFGIPDEINLDGGKALQKACVQTFTQSANIKEYLTKCFAILNKSSSVDDKFKCFVRDDAYHFVCNLHQSKVFDKLGAQVKHFYKCIIGAIMQVASYDEIKTIVKDTLILANYPVEGTLNDGTSTPVEESRVRLQRLIRTHNTDFLSNGSEKSEDEILLSESCDDDIENSDKIDTSLISWYPKMLKEIENSAKIIDASPANWSSNIFINNYQCLELNVYLEDLISKLPLWGCVMNAYFNSTNVTGNTCNVERQFALIKNTIFCKHKLPVSAVVFIENMVKRINSVTTLITLLMRQTNIQNDIRDEFDSVEAPNFAMKMNEDTKVSKIALKLH